MLSKHCFKFSRKGFSFLRLRTMLIKYPYILAIYFLNSSSKNLLILREDLKSKEISSLVSISDSLTFLGLKKPGKVCFFFSEKIESFIYLFNIFKNDNSIQLLWVLHKNRILREKKDFFDFYLNLFNKKEKFNKKLIRFFFVKLVYFIKQLCFLLRLSVVLPAAVFGKRIKQFF